MLAGLTLPFQQLPPFSLQLGCTQFKRAILAIELSTESDQIGHFFFKCLDEVVSHEGYTVLLESQHYNARAFGGSMCDWLSEVIRHRCEGLARAKAMRSQRAAPAWSTNVDRGSEQCYLMH